MKLVVIVLSLLFLGLVSAEILSKTSPAPAPNLAENAADSPPIQAPAPGNRSHSPAKSPIEYSSPPEPEAEHSPSPSDSPSISPPSPNDHTLPPNTPSPSPLPEDSDLNHSDITGIEKEEKATKGGGMSGGTKAGVAFGVIFAVCVVGLAGFVYKKRQDNIRRSRYGYAARDIL